ncbi:coagulation factor 5/8 type-like protein [Paenibacillus sp. HB172176]|uniref:coagulation factor 5/8 type-like protein n=1 Tax=Paenibacillus sp. HB172176 TaxID=2493690 RepID=UPI00143C2A66|nr:coagulation factor 5/8 type-like protein [Paenibacillus sp. HB172176]
MSLNHEFFLLPNDFQISDRIDWYYHNRNTWKNKVEIPDDIILYIFDILNWIPTFNPESKVAGHGLNYYGVTFIHKEGVEKLLKILGKWCELILEAPDIINFKGPTVWREEENGDTFWEETRIKIAKRVYLNEIEGLMKFAEQALINEQYIMHYGI